MADQTGGTVKHRIGGGIHSARGAEAGKTAKYDAIAEKEERQRYRAKHGASGLGGARKAADPKFRAAEDAHIAAWKKRRREAAAKKEAQRRAAAELSEKSKKKKEQQP